MHFYARLPPAGCVVTGEYCSHQGTGLAQVHYIETYFAHFDGEKINRKKKTFPLPIGMNSIGCHPDLHSSGPVICILVICDCVELLLSIELYLSGHRTPS